ALKEAWNLYATQMKSYASLLQDINVYKAQRIEVNGRSTGGDADLYKYFMERTFQLLSPSGRIGLIVPAAFHRSEGAAGIRHLYWDNGTFEQFLEFENRKRLFPIHPMFKFLLMAYQRGRSNGIRKAAFGLSTVKEAVESCSRNSSRSVSLAREFPKQVSGSLLTIPEIRSKTERDLFIKLHNSQPTLGDLSADGWNVSFVRELDMTNDSEAFRDKTQLQRLRCKENDDGSWSSPQGEVYLPLLEGRMVHQYDYAAKAYRGGQGRTSQWVPLPFAEKAIAPHYFVPASYFKSNNREDLPPRAGFCDITGHANERTVLAALIPHGFPCGNKVPTCVFDTSDPRVHLIWLAIANSFVIDWIVRRRISITLNFFHWYQIPFPRVEPNSDVGCELAAAVARLSYLQMQQTRTTTWLQEVGGNGATDLGQLASLTERAQLRADIDAIVAELFNLTHEEFAMILSDFPLLDRYQPPLQESGNRSEGKAQKNNRSTVTRDKALLSYFLRRGEIPPKNINELPVSHIGAITDLRQRVALAEQLGAIAYIPSELAAYSRS
ncbi:MAG: Eco57I restriction-modification methylase domain-containing protein, partial [Pyrinomonadaceae bacterium]